MSDKKPERVLAYIRDHAWSIQPASLETIVEIASRANDEYRGLDTEALAAKLGKRLERTERAEIRGNVGILAVEGPLFRYANLFTMFSGATAYEQLATDFNAMVDNPNVKSIVLNINSPGGQTDGANEFAGMVFAARKKKKVTAYISHLGASAAYLIASAAEDIVMEAMSAVGSIGTVARVYTGKEKDVTEIVSSQSPKKRPDATTDEGRDQIKGYVDALAQVFIDTVARNRGVSVDTVMKDYGQGGVLVGEAAVKAGMADSLGTLESVIASQEETNMSQKTAILLSAVTLAMLQEERPDLISEIQKGVDVSAATKSGADAERARIKAVHEQSLAGHEALVTEAMFDGKSTAADVALKILAVEKTARTTALDKARKEAPPTAAPSADKPTAAATTTVAKAVIDHDAPVADIKAALKPEWDADKELRAEFSNDLDTYTAFRIQESKGKVSFFKKPA